MAAAAGTVTDPHILNNRYELLAEIGRGGMATTYRARDRVLDRAVAVKVMHPNLGQSPEFAAAFRREAQAAARLSHPNIAAVYDSGQDGANHYLVMELVEGETLKARIKHAGGPLPISEAAAIARQIALALQIAHAHGLIHRDIKPHNVLVTPGGAVKVADFGIAQAASATAEDETRVVGSANYLAPEQARGEPGAPTSDIYALGVVLYELLTGALPFTGATPVAVAHRHLYDTARVPRDLNPAVPQRLQEVVLKALQKRPEQRYPDITTFIAALDAATKEAAPAPQVITTPRRKRRRVLPLVLVTVLLLFIAGIGVAMFAQMRANGGSAVTVPILMGTDLTSARALTTSLGLRLTHAGEEFDDQRAPGVIIRQEPGPGTKTAGDAEVQVWTSKGRQSNQVAVPELTGSPLESARDELQNLGLLPDRIVQEYHPTIASGFVTRTLPPAGRMLSPDSRVVLYVSMGPEPPAPPTGATPPPPADTTKSEKVQYTVPTGYGDRTEVVIRLVQEDGSVEVLHQGVHFSGEVIEVTATYRRSAKLQVYVGGRLMHEATLGVPPATSGP